MCELLLLTVSLVRRRGLTGQRSQPQKWPHAHLFKPPSAPPPPRSPCLAPDLSPLFLTHKQRPARPPLLQPLFPSLHRWESGFDNYCYGYHPMMRPFAHRGNWGSGLTGFGSFPSLYYSLWLFLSIYPSLSLPFPTTSPEVHSNPNERWDYEIWGFGPNAKITKCICDFISIFHI